MRSSPGSFREPGPKRTDQTDSPVWRVMGDLERVADAGRGRTDPLLARQLQVKDLVHPSREDHIRVNQHHAFILRQAEHLQLCPGVVEAHERGVEAGMLLRRG